MKVRAICSSACQALMLTNMLVPARWARCVLGEDKPTWLPAWLAGTLMASCLAC